MVVIDAPPADAASAAAPRPVGALDVPDRRGPALNSTSKDVVRGELVVHAAVLLPAPAPGRVVERRRSRREDILVSLSLINV